MAYDEIIEEFFQRDEAPSVEAFGGIDAILVHGAELGRSIYADHYFELVYRYRDSRPSEVDDFIVEMLTEVSRGVELAAITERLFGTVFSTDTHERRLFKHFLSTAGDATKDVVLRAASLKAALGLLHEDNLRLATMVAHVAAIEPTDEPEYIAHAARIAGILFSYRPEPALLDFLSSVKTLEGCADQVSLELGLVDLHNAIQASSAVEVVERLESAQTAFSSAWQLRETRYEARIYDLAIAMLLDFYNHRKPANFTDILDEMKLQAFAYVAYSAGQRSDPVLGSITSQGLALVQLTEKLGSLVGNLGDDIWLEAAAVIESQIVFAYSANRAVFGGQNGKGLDWLVRPTLEPRIFGNRHHAAAIRRWLRERSSHLPQDLVSDLEKAVEGYFESGDPPRPMSAGHSGPLSSALQERVFSTDPESHAALLRILAHNAAVVERSVTLPILRVIQTVEDVFGGLEDYRVPEVKLAFGNLVFHLASFLERKLDSSVEEDKFSAYLFSDGARKPLEKDLQQDFLRHGRSARLPVESEVKGKGGGRADIRYKSDQHEIIIEVKREERDSSFDNLVRSYGEQTVLYQTTNVKLGVMLVLDISRDHVVWPHMDSLYEARVGDFLNDGTQRGVLIMNIPGRRGTPSDATKRAKSLKSRKSSARKNTFA